MYELAKVSLNNQGNELRSSEWRSADFKGKCESQNENCQPAESNFQSTSFVWTNGFGIHVNNFLKHLVIWYASLCQDYLSVFIYLLPSIFYASDRVICFAFHLPYVEFAPFVSCVKSLEFFCSNIRFHALLFFSTIFKLLDFISSVFFSLMQFV